MLTWIAMPSRGSAASVLCGRQLRQSRQRTVDATVATTEHRDADTPGHARAFPGRTCQPAAGAKRTGLGANRAEADVAFDAAVPPTSGATATMKAIKGERHTLELRSETSIKSASARVAAGRLNGQPILRTVGYRTPAGSDSVAPRRPA
jgi:hypothetical protein